MIQKNDILAIYMQDALASDYGKMGLGILRYSKNSIACVIDSNFIGQDIYKVTGIKSKAPIVASIEEANNLGANVLILGTAPSGGRIPDSWHSPVEKAIAYKMSIVNGLHDYLGPRYNDQIKDKKNQWIWDLRIPQFVPDIATAKASKLNNKRLLLVGTDMAVGKMTTGLEIYKSLLNQNIKTGFVATGQIGISILGQGIPLDAYKVDLACGAVETEVMKHKEDDIIIVEGQGSLLHPGSTATLPLMRGSCATHLILCTRADKTTLRKPDAIKIPNLKKFIKLNEDLCGVCGSLSPATTIGIAANTSKLSEKEALEFIQKTEEATGLPTTDVIRNGPSKLVDALIKN